MLKKENPAGGAAEPGYNKTNERSHNTNSRQKSQTKFTFSAEDVKKSLDKAAFYAGELGISLPPAKADGWTENLPCPFHPESVGSFGVNILDGRFHCFGCQAKGDVFDFYQRRRGCDFQTAFQELAKLAGLRTAGSQKKADPDRKKRIFRNQVAEYLYTNADGQPVMLVRKFVDPLDPSDKIFLQYRPDGNGGWIAGVKGHVHLIPYHLPGVIKAGVVFIAEGEKDVNVLLEAGLTATCNPGGAGKWPEDFHQYFIGKDVIVLPDNDDPGRDHAELVARNLAGHAKSIKIIHLPDLPPKGDVSDFFKNNSKAERKIIAVGGRRPAVGTSSG